MTRRRTFLLLFLLTVLLTAAVYLPSFSVPFMSDDIHHIVNNSYVRFYPQEWWRFFSDRGAGTSLPGLQYQIYRPLPVAAFSALYHVFGMSSFWFHAANIILHAMNSCLLLSLLLMLETAPWTAFACAALFGLHPVNVENVALAVGLSSLLAFLFFMLAMIAHTAGRKKWPVYVFYALSLFCRETAIVFPLAAWLMDRTVLKRVFIRGYYSVLGVIAVVYLLARTAVIGHFSHQDLWGFSYLLNTDMVVRSLTLSNLASLVLPWRTHPLVHGIPLGRYPAAEVIGAAVIIAVAIYAIKKYYSKIPHLSLFGLGMMFLCLLPTSNILPLKVSGADRFLYFSSAGLAISLAPLSGRKMLSAGACVIACAVLAWQTLSWQKFYDGDKILLEELHRRYPNDYIVSLSLGESQFASNPAMAVSLFKKSLSDAPVNYRVSARTDIGAARLTQGDYTGALDSYKAALSEDPLCWQAAKGAGLSCSMSAGGPGCDAYFIGAITSAAGRGNKLVPVYAPDGSYMSIKVSGPSGESDIPLPPRLLGPAAEALRSGMKGV